MERQFPQSVYMDDDSTGIAFVITPNGRYATLNQCIKQHGASNEMLRPFMKIANLPYHAEEAALSALTDENGH